MKWKLGLHGGFIRGYDRQGHKQVPISFRGLFEVPYAIIILGSPNHEIGNDLGFSVF